jgi:hypothetical protein
MEATRSSETSAYIKPTRRHIAEDGVLLSHRRENLFKSRKADETSCVAVV